MKIQKTYESLLKDTNNATKYLEQLQRNDFQAKIEDWDAFINLLHDKKLKAESEVVLVNYLSSNILDNEYQNSLSSSQDSKIILNLLNIISFKIKSQTEELKRLLSIPYATLYCYLSRKIYANLQDFNDSHKKIKQRIEEDGKHLIKLLEFCFVDLIGNSQTESGNNQQLFEMIKAFLNQLIKLVKKQPNIFKNQVKFMEHILFGSLERKSESSEQYVLLPEELEEEVILLLSQLPLCVNTVAAYPDRVKYFVNRYINNFYYGFLYICRGIPHDDILRNYSYEDGFATSPNFLFDWESLKATTNHNSSEIKVAMQIRMKFLSKLLRQTIASIKSESTHTWNLLNYLKMIENILTLDAKHLEKQKILTKKSQKDNIQHFDVSLLDNKLALIKEDYEELSLNCKSYALKMLNSLIESSQQGFTKYVEWLYNALYFVTINYESNYNITKNLIKTCISILINCGSLFFEFGEYLLFQSPLNPLDLIQQYYGNYLRQYKQSTHTETLAAVDQMNFHKDKKGNSFVGSQQQDHKGTDSIVSRESGFILTKLSIENDLLRSMSKREFSTITSYILKCISIFLQKCGRLQVKPELIAQLDSAFSKIISYPRVFAISPNENKEAFIECLESVILNNLLKFEESQLIGEFDLFFSQYTLAEKEQQYIASAQQSKNRIYCLRQSKRLSFIDNSIDLQNYFEKRYQEIQIDINNETQAEDSVMQSEIELTTKNITSSVANNQLFSNLSQQTNLSNYGLQKTATQQAFAQRSLEENESWGNEESKEVQQNGENSHHNHNNNEESSKLNLKRTFTDLLSDSSSKGDIQITDNLQKKVQTEDKILFGQSTDNKNNLFQQSASSTTAQALFGNQESETIQSKPEEIKNTNQEINDDNDDGLNFNPVLDSDQE